MHRRSLIAAALAGLPLAAARSQDFPTRPVRVVVGFPPGGGTDLVARPLAQKVQGIFGQSVVVDNRAGANGSVGLEVVAKSPPDGYTIGHVNSSVVVTNPLLYKNLAVNVERDLVPVCTVADSAVVLAVPADLPARDLRELVALAKAKPGQLNFGSGGLGSVDHLSFEVLKRQTGVEFLHVPYRGGGPALNDMIGGRVQLMISSYGMYKGQVDAGRVRIVAVLAPERHPALPDVPTGVEQGWPDLIVPAWQGIVAPAQTPAAILDKVEAAYRSALADPEVKALLISLGYFPIFRGQKDAARMIRDETVRWGTIIRELGIQLD
ncbi:MAG: tripartite tricarboxylate transporter substrate binding protein [Reyranella sp.]|jgi:tripartite-type tricarboxylate transporter receptor subunit TctC|uniref:Bug family tripartite tricarboxylate transporter substrate binding protein n=1 Tax=Reyranella sp. TaxID=1929291 RepID=UPI0025F57571|nr:tripartite tricarboxylate transporter substrate binding protein [Reyranella sp.]MBR2818847.1 tripartite tricarboxylate transporter substrate binding protein [Reyranella sp.]